MRRLSEPERKPTPIRISKPDVFFDIFTKPNKFEKTKMKVKSTPRNNNKKKSLTTVAARQGPNIKTYFKPNQAVPKAVIATPAEQLPEQGEGGKEKVFNCEVRGGESGVTWEPGL